MYEFDPIAASATSSPLGGSTITPTGGTDSNIMASSGLGHLPTPGLGGLDAGLPLGPEVLLTNADGLNTTTELFESANAVLAAALAEATSAPDLSATGLEATNATKGDDLLGISLDGSGAATDGLVAQNNTLRTADNMGVLIGGRAFGDGVSVSYPLDFYQFRLDARSDINLMLAGLSSDADLYLIRDINGNRIVDSGDVMADSQRGGTQVDAITLNNLLAGNYYVAVRQSSGSTSYNLYAAASPDGGIHTRTGNLRADTFGLSDTNVYTVVSGNGNVDFGYGDRDVLDLSAVNSSSISYWNPATATGGGVIYDPGNGGRVFDALGLSNGQHVLMEGLDGIQFRDGFLNLNQGVLPNDPLFSQQWNMHMIGAHHAWRFTQGSAAVAMGIIDSGLGVNSRGNLHPDIDPNRTLSYTPNNNTIDNFLDSNTSHGTAVYGIMAAAGNNGAGMAGLNWRSEVLNIDVFGPDQIGLDAAAQTMLNYTRETGQRLVVNMSLKTRVAIPALEQLIAQNLDNALFVVSSGNDSAGRLAYPAILSNTYSNVVAVGASWGLNDANGRATTPGDRIDYSNYGAGLSLMAPSEVITTAAVRSSGGTVGFGYYGNAPSGTPFNGTSAAAPHISGVASLVWSANPFLSAGQVHNIMQQTAVDLGFPGYDFEYGAGMVNADAAVRRALTLAGVPLRGTTAEAQGLLALPLLANDALTLALPVPGDLVGAESSGAIAADVVNDLLAASTSAVLPTWENRSDGTAAREADALPMTLDSVRQAATTPLGDALSDLVFSQLAEGQGELIDLGAPQVEALWAPLAA
ncbi:MAG: S8 family serine peptidase [Nodosilinea sp.]